MTTTILTIEQEDLARSTLKDKNVNGLKSRDYRILTTHNIVFPDSPVSIAEGRADRTTWNTGSLTHDEFAARIKALWKIDNEIQKLGLWRKLVVGAAVVGVGGVVGHFVLRSR